ncbi:hypothetical protein [Delftia sp. 60]|uniref:hypothetical protein n=1 Tax=Delftia sp. 60 TaxID=2035216 RepID=UPI0015D4FBE5|nr:hypothetical protein [Delftia sp. 60]
MSFDPITNAGVKALQGQVNTVQAQTTALTTKLAQIESTLAGLGTTASRKPLRVTEYTSGAGTHAVLPESSYQIITLMGPGGSGAPGAQISYGYYSGGSGGGGSELQHRVRLPSSVPYEVGTPTSGRTVLAGYIARGGISGYPPSDGTGINAQGGAYYAAGVIPGLAGADATGGNSTMGTGARLVGGVPQAATGYGAGGAGGVFNFTSRVFLAPVAATGGFIRIEEY